VKKIAFLGSRTWQDAQRVALQVNSCFTEHGQFILVSGGAEGASKVAESTGHEFGLPVISFRPVQLSPEEYAVDEWRMHRGRVQIVRHEPTFAEFKGAAWFRSMYVADRSDEGYIYWDGYSPGTAHEIDMFQGRDKKIVVANLRLENGGMK
jgi:hypothetical protein